MTRDIAREIEKDCWGEDSATLAERERCAKICEERAGCNPDGMDDGERVAWELAEEIRMGE